MSEADGSVISAYAVNIFGKGDVTDYGDYSDVNIKAYGRYRWA